MNHFWYHLTKPLADLALACLLTAGLMITMLIGAILRSVFERFNNPRKT